MAQAGTDGPRAVKWNPDADRNRAAAAEAERKRRAAQARANARNRADRNNPRPPAPRPKPGDPNFIGPVAGPLVRKPRPGDPDFIGPVAARSSARSAGNQSYSPGPWSGGYGGGYDGSYMGSGGIQAVINAALAQQGIDYSWGGGGKNGPSRGIEQGRNINGFDCSGLLEYAYWKGAGVSIGGTSAEQRNKGVGVPKDQARAGDLIYWNRPGVSHIAMYLGNGYIIEAPSTGKQVRVIKLSGKNSLENATSVRRIINDQVGARQSGAQYGGEFERLVYAIREQESDHRYDIRGAKTRSGDRAYGAYQVMGANIPSWTREVLGRSMTPEQFLADKGAQDQVARAKLKQLVRQVRRSSGGGRLVRWRGGGEGLPQRRQQARPGGGLRHPAVRQRSHGQDEQRPGSVRHRLQLRPFHRADEWRGQ